MELDFRIATIFLSLIIFLLLVIIDSEIGIVLQGSDINNAVSQVFQPFIVLSQLYTSGLLRVMDKTHEDWQSKNEEVTSQSFCFSNSSLRQTNSSFLSRNKFSVVSLLKPSSLSFPDSSLFMVSLCGNRLEDAVIDCEE